MLYFKNINYGFLTELLVFTILSYKVKIIIYWRMIYKMGFFKNKEDMFNHRADRFKNDGDEYADKGNSKKAEWCYEQEEENREKAEKYKGQKGW